MGVWANAFVRATRAIKRMKSGRLWHRIWRRAAKMLCSAACSVGFAPLPKRAASNTYSHLTKCADGLYADRRTCQPLGSCQMEAGALCSRQ